MLYVCKRRAVECLESPSIITCRSEKNDLFLRRWTHEFPLWLEVSFCTSLLTVSHSILFFRNYLCQSSGSLVCCGLFVVAVLPIKRDHDLRKDGKRIWGEHTYRSGCQIYKMGARNLLLLHEARRISELVHWWNYQLSINFGAREKYFVLMLWSVCTLGWLNSTTVV